MEIGINSYFHSYSLPVIINYMVKFIESLLFWKQCREYGVSIWSCPNFLFLLMGIITVAGMIGTHIVGQRYATPEVVMPAVVLVALFIFIPGGIVVNTFEKVARASKMKTEFVSIVSHQLRTPLSSIKWSLDLLLGERLGNFDTRQREYLHILRDNNERMIKLVSDLLSVSRIESGKLLLRQEEIDIYDLTRGIVHNMVVLAEANSVDLKLGTPEDLPSVLGDETYLGVVITNFIDNAIRYTQRSGVVSVRLSSQDSCVRCEVEDHGVGIPEDDQRLIFEKFFRSRNVMKHQTEGTGLGLFIAQAVIEKMGGKIGFRSQENKGSTFWFEIPAANKKDKC